MPIARTMQLVGYALYAMCGVLRVIAGGDAAPWPWVVAYATLGVAFHVGASAPADDSHRRRRGGALVVMVAALIAMAVIRPCPYGALALVVIASQAALVLSTRLAFAWVAVQTAIVACCLVPALGWLLGGAELIAVVGFQAFAVAAIGSARREASARAELAATNRTLLATRAALDAATREHERTRIARDLHDVLGHDLTALGLQLEIAGHVDAAAARAHTAKARELTARLLRDVRAVVAAVHDDACPSAGRASEPPLALADAIAAMVIDAPGLAIHVDAPPGLVIEDARRADCIVRCIQEIVTNTRRHARGARELWIEIRREDGELVIEAHDDGHGPEAAVAGNGSGLRGMRSRLEELGGGLAIETTPARRFVVNAWLPLEVRA